jgi:hypothetical protein
MELTLRDGASLLMELVGHADAGRLDCEIAQRVGECGIINRLTRFPTYVSNREYRYSAFTVHLSNKARSMPAPSTQPALICEEDTASPITAGGFQAALDQVQFSQREPAQRANRLAFKLWRV